MGWNIPQLPKQTILYKTYTVELQHWGHSVPQSVHWELSEKGTNMFWFQVICCSFELGNVYQLEWIIRRILCNKGYTCTVSERQNRPYPSC